MNRLKNCPLCEEDVSETWQAAEPDVGIMSSGWYCDACDLIIEGDEQDDDGEGDYD